MVFICIYVMQVSLVYMINKCSPFAVVLRAKSANGWNCDRANFFYKLLIILLFYFSSSSQMFLKMVVPQDEQRDYVALCEYILYMYRI